MSAQTDLPPYDPQRIVNAPFPERVRLACVTWANASPNLPSVMALYWMKYFFPLIGGWAFWCSFNAGYPGFFSDRRVGVHARARSRRRWSGRSSGSSPASAAAGAR